MIAARALAVSCAVLATVTGCAFHGLNSLPLPGTVGRGPGATVYHVEVANVGTLESNSPVMINDAVVGSVGEMTVHGWHADLEISVQPDVVIPANAVASVGQTSLLGSMHLELNPPLGEPPRGRLQPGATIPLSRSSTYPSTEQTLSSLAAIVNGGGLGQIGDIVHNFNGALSGRAGEVRDLLVRLDKFVGVLDEQHDNIIASIRGLNRLATTFADQRDVVTQALRKIPPALDVLIKERPRITTALDKLRVFSDTATGLINDTQADLVKNLKNLEPSIKALADVGPDLDTALAYLPLFPFPQDLVDRGIRGDYINLFEVLDFTVPRLKTGLLAGSHWEEVGAPLVPAPGDPYYLQYTYDPLHVGVAPPPQPGVPPAGPQAPPPNSAFGPPPGPGLADAAPPATEAGG
ncbi:MCE family protein [Mycobacterium shimoidei]|uniref:MCE family protein [Rhodococcus jostii RHA1] n=1 Tax=Mycobacterium shimoidei TaxID=29313 RepID=A0A1E3TDX6_MYCSH|nr:MCE family protein [Mycobacterium shimoidei]MCV7258391.1 MCE family protein [Mycobacterium shimoidei]ODR12642.1 mammalian cell entry protein [Mycobacterium shimoidei]ORW81748.1 mammalian cell entry protein [Mycobacterium shimoidei]SRX93734.1 MCE family protein [Rhodococcus jostii RHA1] [Mycobacterium shimoidei]